MVLHDEILVGDLSKFGIKYLTIECQCQETCLKVFRIIPEFRILRGNFPKKVSLKMLNSTDYNSFFVRSISECLIRQLTI